MKTVTITKKEYNALVFAKVPSKAKTEKNIPDWDVAFGIIKNAFGRLSAASAVRKLRKSWRA